MSLHEKLKDRGYGWVKLPNRHPVHPLRIASRRGDIITTSGQIPFRHGVIKAENIIAGRVGKHITPSDAAKAAELAALQCLYAAGSLVDPDGIIGVEHMEVHVNCALGFNDTSGVANGASDFFIELFGDAGMGTRIAIGAAELPFNAVVEIVTRFDVRGGV